MEDEELVLPLQRSRGSPSAQVSSDEIVGVAADGPLHHH